VAAGRAAVALRSVAVPAALLLAWEAVSRVGWVTPLILPAPSAVALRWWTYLAPTEAFDPAAASRLGLIMGARPLAYALFNPVLQLLRPIPPIAYIPLAILWFGLGNPPAFFLISLGAFFPVLMNTIAGVRAVDAIYLRAARNLGAGEWTLFWRVMIPAAMPYILTGVRVGIGVAFIVVIVAEMIAVNSGLGYRILEAREYFWSDKVIAGMATIGLCGLGIDLGMSRLNGWLLRWHRGVEG